jgi:alpha-1,2-mannosyltransferase
MALYVVGGLLCFQILFMFLAAPFLRVFVTLISWTLRKKTEGRKQQLMQLMTEEDKNEPKSSSSEEWEKVPSSEELKEKPSKSKFDKKWNRSWDGIVGFFHPFWYVLLLRTAITVAQPLTEWSQQCGRRW